MRKILTTALLIAGTTASAYAADLPLRTAPVYAPPPLPVFTWTGGYFGINAGYAFDYSSRFRTFDDPAVPAVNANGVATGVRPASFTVHSDGFTAGGQVGYNYQFGAGSGIVVGLEADAAYTDLDETRTVSLTNQAGATRFSRFHSDMDFLGTVRGRLGYAFDRFMIYGTGGLAYWDVNVRSRFFSSTGALTYAGGRDTLETGYAYGGGIEYAMPTDSFLNFFHSSAVTVKAEYLHYDLGTSSLTLPATGLGGSSGAYTQRVRTDGDLARIGLNYKF